MSKWDRFLLKHVFFINIKGKREVRGRWFLILAAAIYLGGNYIVYRLLV